ncbi:carboxylating nicotinate-nucleotide diphosphorylase [Myxococcota bacterium]|nr:carboxylating nicotinate-nucleotide diphosphorylase [Myxococcota bacterium]MBU1383087.1 carboxylating nicotinate-nucleotide diphosphorylase [Myxococcota bacterium]MBU1498260.1 carboxylating nicotinate-nucleotide diphosphorylase [Myxococcota bacterium]
MIKTPAVAELIELALNEDLCGGDPTSEALFDENSKARAVIKAKSDLIICGLPLISMVFQKVDPQVTIVLNKKDGDFCPAQTSVVELNGRALSILAAERTILNFLQRMSGIATRTRKTSSLTPLGILDTRKTTPGHRILEKYAVKIGGGRNHRLNLSGGIMIKDNHIDAFGSITNCVKRIKSKVPHTLKIEVEVRNFDEAREAVDAGADIILLDNMTTEAMKRICNELKGLAIFEASGGITESRLAELTDCGLDFVSMGALTHSVTAADLSMTIAFETQDKL